MAGHRLPTPTSLDLPGASGLVLRMESPDDVPFLDHLYAANRWPELDPTGWPDQDKVLFLRQQFNLQRHHYLTHYADAAFWIVQRDGQDVGRLYLWRGTTDLRIVDISLSPEHRNRGWGTILLRAVQDEARRDGKTVSIHVEKFNPAQNLYRRLGFVQVQDVGAYWKMEWQAQETEGATL